MKYFKVIYNDNSYKILESKNALTLIKKYGLYTKEHINTRIKELEKDKNHKT